jgi:hypothetical protein
LQLANIVDIERSGQDPFEIVTLQKARKQSKQQGTYCFMRLRHFDYFSTFFRHRLEVGMTSVEWKMFGNLINDLDKVCEELELRFVAFLIDSPRPS